MSEEHDRNTLAEEDHEEEEDDPFFPPYQIPMQPDTSSSPYISMPVNSDVEWSSLGQLLFVETKLWLELRAPQSYGMLERICCDSTAVLFGDENLVSFARRFCSTLIAELQQVQGQAFNTR